MFIDSYTHPGPAIWFGIMLLTTPVFTYYLCKAKTEAQARTVAIIEVLFGIVLFFIIVFI